MTMTTTASHHLQRALSGDVVVDIGQIDKEERRALDRAVKRGEIVKWRGYFWPHRGHPTCGIGPLKTCYAINNPYVD
jgi:hypothetical protein